MSFENRENNLRSLSGRGKLFVGHANKIASLRRSIFSARKRKQLYNDGDGKKKLNGHKIKYNR